MVTIFGRRSIFQNTFRILGKCYSKFKQIDYRLDNITSGRKFGLTVTLIRDNYCNKYESRRHYSECMKQPPCVRDQLICDVVEPFIDGLNKVTIVGTGMVGIACANAILFQKISSHVALIDAFPKKLKGEGMDYTQGLCFLDDPRLEYDTDFCVSTNSKVVIVTTGARPHKSESCLEFVQRNADIIKCIIMPLVEFSPKAIFIIVSNPVDILSWLAWKVSGLPVNRVIGSGTHLDSAIFRQMLGRRLGVASKSVHGWIIGEHGDTQVPLWSGVNVAGVLFRDILPNIGLPTDEEKWLEVAKQVINTEEIIRCLKGYSNTAIGLSVADITNAILRNSQSVKAVSTLAQGHYGICEELFLSMPCVIGENGVSGVIRVRMTEFEKKSLQTSADTIYHTQKEIKFS